jgi:hypothetical protein
MWGSLQLRLRSPMLVGHAVLALATRRTSTVPTRTTDLPSNSKPQASWETVTSPTDGHVCSQRHFFQFETRQSTSSGTLSSTTIYSFSNTHARGGFKCYRAITEAITFLPSIMIKVSIRLSLWGRHPYTSLLRG